MSNKLGAHQFQDDGDDFGYFTTYSNLGALRHKSGDLQGGLEILREAYVGLLPYGAENITHCALSLAAASFVQKEDREAVQILRKVIDLPEDSHYALAAKSISAQLYLVEGKSELAIQQYRALMPRVCETPTQNLKTSFFVNFSMAKAVLGEFDEEYTSCLHLALENRSQRPSMRWKQALGLATDASTVREKMGIDTFRKHSLKGYYEYWWFNPTLILTNLDR